MPHQITQDCIACGDCSVVCPEEAIDDGYTYNTTGDINSTTDVVMDGAMDDGPFAYDIYRVKSNCNDCGSCRQVCPVDAIRPK